MLKPGDAHKRLGTKNGQFRRPIPRTLLSTARGQRFIVDFPEVNGVKAKHVDVVIGNDILCSYGTTNKEVIALRECIAESHYRALLVSWRAGRMLYSDLQISTMAEMIYRFYKEMCPDTSGLPNPFKVIEGMLNLDFQEMKKLFPILKKPQQQTAYFEINEEPVAMPYASNDFSLNAVEYRVGALSNWFIFANNVNIAKDDRVRLMIKVDEISRYATFGRPYVLQELSTGDQSKITQDHGVNSKKASLTSILTRWSNAAKRPYNTLKSRENIISNLQAFLGHDNAHSISGDDFVRWQAHLVQKGYAANTINLQYIAGIKALFSYALKTKMLSNNNSDVLTKIKSGPKRTRKGYSDFEIIKIVEAAQSCKDELIKWVILLTINTGSRISEITQLGYDQIKISKGANDGEDIVWVDLRPSSFVGAIKVHVGSREVPLVSKLIGKEFLDFVKRRSGQPLFYDYDQKRLARSAPYEGVSKRTGRWVKTIIQKDLAKDTHHAMRHWIQSRAPRASVEMDLIEDIVGHQRFGTRGTYTEYEIVHKLRELEKVFAVIPDVESRDEIKSA